MRPRMGHWAQRYVNVLSNRCKQKQTSDTKGRSSRETVDKRRDEKQARNKTKTAHSNKIAKRHLDQAVT